MTSHDSQAEAQVTKRYQLPKNVDLGRFPTLPAIVTLMMFKDAVLSSYRWYESLKDKDGVEAFSDRTFSVLCGAGWAAEAIRFLKDLKKVHIITDKTLSKMPESEPIHPKVVWDECVGHGSETTGRLHKIRDTCFAHFHDRNETEDSKKFALAHNALDAHASGNAEIPFVEWMELNGKKANTSSCATFAMSALLLSMFGRKGELSLENGKAIGDQVLKIGILLENLLSVLIIEAGIKLEPFVSKSQSE